MRTAVANVRATMTKVAAAVTNVPPRRDQSGRRCDRRARRRLRALWPRPL
jgi:hypothetical protein